jgi:hypothetical protein
MQLNVDLGNVVQPIKQLVTEAMINQGDLAPLQIVVEKELLHHAPQPNQKPRYPGHRLAKIRAELYRAGQLIGPYDMMIAGHARAKGLVLVTNNIEEFKRVPGLLLENWVS